MQPQRGQARVVTNPDWSRIAHETVAGPDGASSPVFDKEGEAMILLRPEPKRVVAGV